MYAIRSYYERQRFERFHLLRIERDLKRGAGEGEGDEARLAKLERELRQEVEGEIRRRMQVIARTVRTVITSYSIHYTKLYDFICFIAPVSRGCSGGFPWSW